MRSSPRWEAGKTFERAHHRIGRAIGSAAGSADLVKNTILQPHRERATPAETPPSPFSAAIRLAADWLAGIGFLRFYAAAYAIAGAALLLIDLILNPSDPWAVD